MPERVGPRLAVVDVASGARALPARATTSATPTSRWPTPSARSWPSAPARAPGGPVRLLTNLRCLGHLFNPVSFYYCFDRAGEELRGRRRRGDEHAVGRAPRLRPGRARRRTAACASASTRSSTSRPSWPWTTSTSCASRPPGRDLGVEIVSRKDGEVHFDASLQLDRAPARRARPAARAAPPAGADAGGRGAHLRQRRAAEAQGRAVLRPPARGAAVSAIASRARSCTACCASRAAACSSCARPAARRCASARSIRPSRCAPCVEVHSPAFYRRAAARQRRARRGAHGRPVVEPRPRRARAPGRAQRRGARPPAALAAPAHRPRPARSAARATRSTAAAARSPPTTTSATTSSRSSSTSG